MKCNRQNFLSFWAILCSFTPTNNLKNHIFEKMKKAPKDIIILHKCTKNHDHLLYCSWDMACGGCNFFHFGAFSDLLPPNSPKNSKLKNMKETSGDNIILHVCTKNYDHMMYGSWDTVEDGRTDGRINGQMDERNKWHTEVGVPPKKKIVKSEMIFLRS